MNKYTEAIITVSLVEGWDNLRNQNKETTIIPNATCFILADEWFRELIEDVYKAIL